MKTELLKIAKDLEQGAVTAEQAQTLLLGLFSVRQRTFTEWLRKNFQNNIDDESLWEDYNMIIERPPKMYTSNELINFYDQYVA
jgi:hypothetical protein